MRSQRRLRERAHSTATGPNDDRATAADDDHHSATGDTQNASTSKPARAAARTWRTDRKQRAKAATDH